MKRSTVKKQQGFCGRFVPGCVQASGKQCFSRVWGAAPPTPPRRFAALFSALLRAASILLVLAAVVACNHTPPPAAPLQPRAAVKENLPAPPQPEETKRLAPIDEAAREEIASGHIPGVVILVGRNDRVLYRKAFGSRFVEPQPLPMTEDTIFDISSMTKVVATTTAIMQLADRGRLRIDDPVSVYWPEFAQNGKEQITIRRLLTHSSGMRADVNSRVRWSGYNGALSAIACDKPVCPPGTAFRYSDANFIVLGEIVRRVSGLPLDAYCTREIFEPLGMRDTSFRPAKDLKPRIAPCDIQNGELRCGEVQDPTAYRMGQVAGHAGLFSTADDLSVFAGMLLGGGTSRGRRILSPGAVHEMTTANTIPGSATVRGLGWDILSPYGKEHTASFPAGSFGHTGYTGTSLWIDPGSGTYLIILTNRLYPGGKGEVKTLRSRVAAVVASAMLPGKAARAGVLRDAEKGSPAGDRLQARRNDRVRLGIDVLASSGFAPLAGKRVGVITNQTGIDAEGRSTISLLHSAPGVTLCAVFSPEHGLAGNVDEKVSSGKDPSTGLPVYSLYGEVKRPTPEMLRGLDALVYDIQDVGARFYTYITTMAYAMEAAAAAHIDFFVLDRPNPIGASIVQGPVMDRDLKCFTGYFPLPVRYGMTAGELARLFNDENATGAGLHVVKMEGYRRETWFDETGLRWVNPSPNIRSVTEAVLYPGVALVESSNVSVGRGTDMPFEVVGAPWIDRERLAGWLNRRNIGGVSFEPVSFTPKSGPFANKPCGGARLRLTDRDKLDAPALGIELASALYRLYPSRFQIDGTLGMIGSREVLQAIKNGADPRDIRTGWMREVSDFCRMRDKYLLY